MSNFLSSPFLPVMANFAAGGSAGESAPLTMDKWDILESKLLRTSSETNSCLQELVSLLNQWIAEKNQGWLQNEEDLKILGNNFKNRWKKISVLL